MKSSPLPTKELRHALRHARRYAARSQKAMHLCALRDGDQYAWEIVPVDQWRADWHMPIIRADIQPGDGRRDSLAELLRRRADRRTRPGARP